MIVCFHMAMFVANEFFTPEWLRDARDITREVVECFDQEKEYWPHPVDPSA